MSLRVRVKNESGNRLVRGFIYEKRVREGDEFEIADQTVIRKFKDPKTKELVEYECYEDFSSKIMEAIDKEGNVIKNFKWRWPVKQDGPEVKSARKSS